MPDTACILAHMLKLAVNALLHSLRLLLQLLPAKATAVHEGRSCGGRVQLRADRLAVILQLSDPLKNRTQMCLQQECLSIQGPASLNRMEPVYFLGLLYMRQIQKIIL